jgi:hypothetical protein
MILFTHVAGDRIGGGDEWPCSVGILSERVEASGEVRWVVLPGRLW